MNPYKSKQWRAGYEAGRSSIDLKEQALLKLWRRSHNGQAFAEAYIRHCENVASGLAVEYEAMKRKLEKQAILQALILMAKNELNTLCPGIVEDIPIQSPPPETYQTP